MIMHPDGRLEGTPEEFKAYQDRQWNLGDQHGLHWELRKKWEETPYWLRQPTCTGGSATIVAPLTIGENVAPLTVGK